VIPAIKLSSPATAAHARGFWEIPVLFEDEHLLALDKPAGLLVSPDRHDATRPNLASLIRNAIAEKKPWVQERNLDYLAHAHRLDFETSGVLLFAKNKAALIALANSFGAETPGRHFIALAWGCPPETNFAVEARLALHPLKIGQMCVSPNDGKQAHTDFVVQEQFSDWCRLRCTPRTERIHQIRIHLKHAGFPLVGDDIYGGKKLWLSRLKKDFRLKPGHEERPLLGRTALHAEELSLPHPVTQEPVTIKSEWPKDLKVAVKYLRQYAN
jgi:23S rRNA pseudouridine955/2504/2580 synthase/23S rRNA pseudouridine1911/1915/1917 synthase